MDFAINKGLDLPLGGKPIQSFEAARPVNSVAILGNEYNGMELTMLVEQGQTVKLGQALFSDKKNHESPSLLPVQALLKILKVAVNTPY
jgi:Na+-transporting NADH:ubiquinone oxidoreductase subunit A